MVAGHFSYTGDFTGCQEGEQCRVADYSQSVQCVSKMNYDGRNSGEVFEFVEDSIARFLCQWENSKVLVSLRGGSRIQKKGRAFFIG